MTDVANDRLAVDTNGAATIALSCPQHLTRKPEPRGTTYSGKQDRSVSCRGMILVMPDKLTVAVGRVVDGNLEVEGSPLEEGRRVRIFIFDDSPVSLTEKQRRFLVGALADVERGEVLAAIEFLERPRSENGSPAE